MQRDKLSAGMSALVEELRHQGGTAMMMAGPRAVPLAGVDPAGGPPIVFAYVRVAADAVLPDLPGVQMLTQTGASRTALVSLDGLDALTEQEGVRLVSPSVMLRPLNDVAGQKTQLPAFRSSSGTSGRNVVVGVVDTGIDASHPAFAGRIHSIWDQTITGAGWGTTTYGTVLSGATLAVSRDTNGHGTHVAGTAAGRDTSFGGVAPDATLVIVKTNFLNAGIGDGIRYVFHVAEELGLPAVVNLSLGGHFDPHDGSDDLSVLIDGRSGVGRIVVAAAGNEGGDDIHASATIAAGQTANIPFVVPANSQPGNTPWVVLNGWYPQNGSCEISIVTSSGNSTPFQPVIANGSPAVTHAFSNATVRVTTPPATASPNGDHTVLVEITPGQFMSAVQGGNWQLRVRNRGTTSARFDVWSLVPAVARDVTFNPPFERNDMKIGSPGCAASAITVAAFTTRNQWTDSTGASRAVGLALDTISDFSSPGPLRTGGRKPDVAAPGAMIVSCTSSHSSPTASNVVTTRFRVNAGTSMASPFVAGLVALLLERDPTLTPAAAKALLKANSTIPGQTAGTFDAKWGFGLIDASGL
jgi:subtilisin family serine protease